MGKSATRTRNRACWATSRENGPSSAWCSLKLRYERGRDSRRLDIVEFRSLSEVADVDALYVVGIPCGAIDEDGRTRLWVTTDHLDKFVQRDDGIFVRKALLEFLSAPALRPR